MKAIDRHAPLPRYPSVGAQLRADEVFFRVWAPARRSVDVVLHQRDGTRAIHPMTRDAQGYWTTTVKSIGAGARYHYRLDGILDRPDPASRAQPEGVHGPSMVIDLAFDWRDSDWLGLPRENLIIYELHVGTFSEVGTFDGVIERLSYLRSLGVTAIELMPVADFQGERNWGYDGVALYAPAWVYGGVPGFKRLVDAAHREGLAVILDVVYNHLGPSGNYLRDFSSDYFTDRHQTPWGDAPDFDGENAGPVRDFFIENACYWMEEYHLDGLRLDAVHEIVDQSDRHVLSELADALRELLPEARHYAVFAEHPRNEARLALPRQADGHGLDGIWADDFGHVVRVTLTGEQQGHLGAYRGGATELARVLQDGWLYQGEPDRRTGRLRGSSADALAPNSLVYAIETHDYVGNRALGERLGSLITPATYRAVSALLLLSPGLPMLFMGQEWGASSPFLYFTDHDEELGRKVVEGRRKEFAAFSTFQKEAVPDPQNLDTFLRSRLRWQERSDPAHKDILALYRDLITFRKGEPLYQTLRREDVQAWPIGDKAVAMRLDSPRKEYVLFIAIVLDTSLTSFRLDQEYIWELVVDTEASRYGGKTSVSNSRSKVTLSGPCAVVFRGVKDV